MANLNSKSMKHSNQNSTSNSFVKNSIINIKIPKNSISDANNGG